ncbi:AAA family ATPase [Stratiformator vulcanicus]|uniref:Chromosome partitioning protein ParA n=1 Tax=Stratiformator vulcanicus TaxID=2527980 RepID=A0A517R1H6_9PLAN|nr:AAA family ATPase [Stratiformator vulcanicus]QDT37711.1 Chromosome partitioning protein ParA [Stratiformator vulcanicus]
MLENTFDYLVLLSERSAPVFVAGIVGLILGALFTASLTTPLGFLLRRVFGGSSRPKRVDDLVAACEAAVQRAEQAEAERKALQSDYDQLEADRAGEREQAADEAAELQQEIDRLNEQIQEIVDSDGRVWEKLPTDDVPPFIPKQDRQALVVAVANLKGGVGKTTVTANLGAALASGGSRVLLIDLDHQHSLSDLCFPEQKRGDLKCSGRLIDHFFDPDRAPHRPLRECIERVGDTELHCIVSDEFLADAETKAMATWLVGQSDSDVRYWLRTLLHDPDISERFDWILIDCPPRLTTGTVNALAAADEVLVPVLLDAPSMNAVPRMLKWLYQLKHHAGVCPNASLLGVIANRTNKQPSLTSNERDSWQGLQAKANDRWDDPIHFFERFIPGKVAFADAAKDSKFAADDPALKAVFLDLVREVRTQVPHHHEGSTSPQLS